MISLSLQKRKIRTIFLETLVTLLELKLIRQTLKKRIYLQKREKVKKKKTRKWYEPAKKEDLPKTGDDYADTINILNAIASLQSGKSTQIAAKKLAKNIKK